MRIIEKPTILITSLGRTGTDFFAKLFAHIVPDSTSLHEPDIIQSVGVDGKLIHFVQQVRRAGVWRMIFLKALGRWTLVRLSDNRFKDKLDDPNAVKNLYAQRKSFIDDLTTSVYVEANIGYYGLIDITPRVFKNHRLIYIVRDGRDWIRSHLDWGEFYGKTGIRKLISHNWPAATDILQDSYAEKWDDLSRFERLCWAWTSLNNYALKTISKNADARMFHFEDIFLREERYLVLNELVAFTTSLPGIDIGQVGSTRGWLEKKIHKGSDSFPAWNNWTNDQKKQFENICGPLMNKLGYSIK